MCQIESERPAADNPLIAYACFPAPPFFGRRQAHSLRVPTRIPLESVESDVDFAVKGGWVWSKQSTPGNSGTVTTQTDTSVSATVTYSGISSVQTVLGLAANIPTGRPAIFGTQANARMDSDYMPVATFGEGLNIGPTIAFNVPLNDKWVYSIGYGFTHRGTYIREATYDPASLPQQTVSHTPSDVRTLTSTISYTNAPLAVSLTGTWAQESLSYENGVPSLRLGDGYSLSLAGTYQWSENNLTTFGASWFYNRPNKVLNLDALSGISRFSAEEFDSNSQIVNANLGHTYSMGAWTMDGALGFLYRSHNSFSPITYQFVSPKTMWSVGPAVTYRVSDTVSLRGSATYFWAHEFANPDKILGGVVVPGSGNPDIYVSGVKLMLGGSGSF